MTRGTAHPPPGADRWDGAGNDPRAAEAAFATLRREHPHHFLALRVKPGSSPPPGPRTPGSADCGPRALLALCRKLGVETTLTELRRRAGTTLRGASLEGLAEAARGLGLRAQGVQLDRDALESLKQPAIAWADGDHYLAVLSVSGGQAVVQDPDRPRQDPLPTAELLRRSGGILLLLSR